MGRTLARIGFACRAWMTRRRVLALCLILLLVGYAGFVVSFGDDLAGSEQRFGSTEGDRVEVYVTVLSIDAVNEAAHLRIYATRSAGPVTTLRLDDGFAVQEIAMPSGGSTPASAVEITLRGGRASRYPLERFRARVGLSAFDGAAVLPIGLTVWDGIAGWHIRATAEPGEAAVALQLRRSAGLVLLVFAIYGTMVMIGSAALAVGTLIFLRVRRLEATFAGFLSGILFALPAMRYALPGSPPFGILADQLAFLWAELAASIGLLLFVLCWAMHGPRN